MPAESEPTVAGAQWGMKCAVSMARAGNLRLSPLPFERGDYPYTVPLRPWAITVQAWRSWWRERRRR